MSRDPGSFVICQVGGRFERVPADHVPLGFAASAPPRRVRASRPAPPPPRPSGPVDKSAETRALLARLEAAEAAGPAYPAEWLPEVAQPSPLGTPVAAGVEGEGGQPVPPPPWWEPNGTGNPALDGSAYPSHWLAGAGGASAGQSGGEGFINRPGAQS